MINMNKNQPYFQIWMSNVIPLDPSAICLKKKNQQHIL